LEPTAIKGKKFEIRFDTLNRAAAVRSHCNELFIYNTGSNTVLVNSIPLQPGAGFIVSGHINEEDTTVYQVSFQGAGNPSAVIVRKFYVE
jgi:hypothetical protein